MGLDQFLTRVPSLGRLIYEISTSKWDLYLLFFDVLKLQVSLFVSVISKDVRVKDKDKKNSV